MTNYEPLPSRAGGSPDDDVARTFNELRSRCPVHRFDGWGPPLFTLSRHGDVQSMLRDPRSWSSQFGQGPWRTEEPGIRNDPPEHTLYRRVLSQALSAQAVTADAGAIRTVTERVIDDLPRDACDLLDDLTAVVPFRVFAPILGMSLGEVVELWGFTHEVLASPEDADPSDVVPFETQKAKVAWQRAFAQVMPHLDRRRSGAATEPLRNGESSDLLTSMATARDGDGALLPDDALVHVVMLVLFGAVHTAATMLTNSVLRLLEDGRRWTALCNDLSLADAVVEESLRFDAPVAGIFRTTTRPVDLHGMEIPVGAKVRGLFAAANRDPEIFDDSDEFRLDRDPVTLARRHLGFGFGVHLCAGAPLARLEGRIVLQVLANRLPHLHVSGPNRWWEERDAITLRERHLLVPVAW